MRIVMLSHMNCMCVYIYKHLHVTCISSIKIPHKFLSLHPVLFCFVILITYYYLEKKVCLCLSHVRIHTHWFQEHKIRLIITFGFLTHCHLWFLHGPHFYSFIHSGYNEHPWIQHSTPRSKTLKISSPNVFFLSFLIVYLCVSRFFHILYLK